METTAIVLYRPGPRPYELLDLDEVEAALDMFVEGIRDILAENKAIQWDAFHVFPGTKGVFLHPTKISRANQ